MTLNIFCFLYRGNIREMHYQYFQRRFSKLVFHVVLSKKLPNILFQIIQIHLQYLLRLVNLEVLLRSKSISLCYIWVLEKLLLQNLDLREKHFLDFVKTHLVLFASVLEIFPVICVSVIRNRYFLRFSSKTFKDIFFHKFVKLAILNYLEQLLRGHFHTFWNMGFSTCKTIYFLEKIFLNVFARISIKGILIPFSKNQFAVNH